MTARQVTINLAGASPRRLQGRIARPRRHEGIRQPECARDFASSGIEGEVERQKTSLLFRNAGIATVVHAVNAALFAYVNVTLHASPGIALLWWSLIASISLARFALARRFSAADPRASEATQWRHAYLATTALAAAAWGAGALLFMWQAPDTALLFSGLVLAGMVAGAVPILAPAPAAFMTFAFPMLVPVAAVVLLQASSALHWAFGSVTIVFLVAVLVSARYLHETLDVSIRLGLEQRRLAERLEVARDTAESALDQQRQAQATLRASEERYRLILQYLPTGILHYDNDLILTYCNDRLAQIVEVRRDDLIDFDMKALKDQRILPALRAALEGKEGAYEGEYISTRSGAHLRLSMSCAPLRGGDGRVEGGIAIIENITERKRAEDEIRHLAYFDPLTHLPNRRLLMDRLGRALLASKRSGECGALLMLDLDHFKAINDSLGHDIGDRLLIEVAQRLNNALRREDTVSRLGGDEYVVLMEDLGQSERRAATYAEAVAEKIRAVLNHPYALFNADQEHFNTTSIGLTLFCGQGESAETLIKQADMALYQAKDAGRNTVRFFNPSMQASIEARTALEAALRRGVQRNEFRLYYQPQVDTEGRLIGAEALIRWLPERQEPVPPSQFIPLAEESGLILLIGQWTLNTALAQLKEWERNPRTRDLQLSVNVSARQFHQPDFVDLVRESLLASGANPARLKLELTEGVVLSNVEEVIDRMQRLTDLGIGFSLDDFGTGYSSLLYLKRLPLEQVKIDRSFVRDLTQDPNDAAIVEAILAMGRSLGLNTIAEGVETEAQRDFLRAKGCQAYQGYLFGEPMPIEEWGRLL